MEEFFNEMKKTEEISEEKLKKAKVTFAIFISNEKKKLKQCGRNYNTFIEKEYHWLQGNVMTNKSTHFGLEGPINNGESLESEAKDKRKKNQLLNIMKLYL